MLTVLTVKRWGLTTFLLIVQFALAQGPGQQVCASQLTELGAQPPDTDWFPTVWNVPIGKFQPFLATIEGIKDLSLTSFGFGPPGSSEREEVTDSNYLVAATCSGHLLFFSKNWGRYLVTVDLLQNKKLSGIGGLFGVPSQAWRVNDSVYAVNLFEGEINLEGLIFNVMTGEVLFYAGPSRYGDLKVALVVPEKGVLLENYTWGAPSARDSVGLLLFDLADGEKRRTPEETPSCLVKLPPNAYEWRFTLQEEGVVLHAKTFKNEQPLSPSESTNPEPTPSMTPPPSSPAPSIPPPPANRPSSKPEVATSDVTIKVLESCRAITAKLLN